MNYANTLFATVSLLALTACGSSNGGNNGNQVVIDPAEEVTRTFADAGQAGQALADGETLTARQVAMAGISLDYDDLRDGNTALEDVQQIAIELNDDGELTLFINGQEQAFTADDYFVEPDGTVYGYFNQDNCDMMDICNNLFSFSGTLDEFKQTDNGFHKVVILQTNQLTDDGAINTRAFAVVGTETRDADLESLGTATYSGYSRINVYPSTGFVDNGTSRYDVEGDVLMSADFGAGSISGVVDNLNTREPGGDFEATAGTLVMSETTFAVNGFQGDIAPDADFIADTGADFDGTYSGAFYGTEADEVAGAITATGMADDIGDFNAIGFFSAYKD